MQILHVITGLQRAAGTTLFCVRMADETARLGHTVAIAVPHPLRKEDMRPELCDVVVWQPGETLPFTPDIIHIHGIWPLWLHRVHRHARRLRIPVILSAHGMLAPWAMAHKRWKKLLPWWIYQRHDVAHATHLHTTSPQETAWLRALGFTNHIIEAPLGTDLPARLASHTTEIRYLLFVGRIYPVKGLDLLLRAWARVKDEAREKSWKLRIVGPDQADYRKTLETLAETLGLRLGNAYADIEADILFTGPLYGAEKDAAYQTSRLLILPSYTENFGGVVIDALSFGLPVLTSEATPWHFLSEAECGTTFALNDPSLAQALVKVFAESDTARQTRGLKGRKLVEERYTWAAVAHHFIQTLES